ncbi:putative ATP-dependent RNA helicase [Candidatus Norongarragalina meridionalis]|nr:putative ATP-dependent RNA helicase [Candidatus Norongarragalina meridionalis]
MAELDLTLLRKGASELRDYQLAAASEALKGGTLLVMPTALGKTFVAAMVAAHVLAKSPKKILFLTPTKPLAMQQAKRMRELLEVPSEQVMVVTGEIAPEKRAANYSSARIVCGTPQSVENDVLTRRLSLSEFSLIVFDEAHRAIGGYSYSFLGKQAKESGALILALTASPSSKVEKIREICENLGIERIEIKTESDEDVREYAQKIKTDWEFVELPQELLGLRDILQEQLSECLQSIKKDGYLETADLRRVNKRTLLALRPIMAKDIPKSYGSLSMLARTMNYMHAIDLLESQGVASLYEFLVGLKQREEKTKAVQAILADHRYAKLLARTQTLKEGGFEHPKMKRMREIAGAAVREGKSVIVFAHFRDSVSEIEKQLNADGVRAEQLVGMSGDGGMSQKEQHALLEKFRAKEFDVLVATSVAEEGLDIPSVDLVVFYEPVPSEIRLIQRRGRTGRMHAGSVIILVTKGTKDEAFLWISRAREKKMRETLHGLRGELSRKKQKSLGDYSAS